MENSTWIVVIVLLFLAIDIPLMIYLVKRKKKELPHMFKLGRNKQSIDPFKTGMMLIFGKEINLESFKAETFVDPSRPESSEILEELNKMKTIKMKEPDPSGMMDTDVKFLDGSEGKYKMWLKNQKIIKLERYL